MTKSYPNQLEYTLAMVPGMVFSGVVYALFLFIFFISTVIASGSNPLDRFEEFFGFLIFSGFTLAFLTLVLGILSTVLFFAINWSFGIPLSSSSLVMLVAGFTMFTISHWLPLASPPGKEVYFYICGPVLGTLCGTLVTYRYEKRQKLCVPPVHQIRHQVTVKDFFALTFWAAILIIFIQTVPYSLFVYLLAAWIVFQALLIFALNKISPRKNVAANV